MLDIFVFFEKVFLILCFGFCEFEVGVKIKGALYKGKFDNKFI